MSAQKSSSSQQGEVKNRQRKKCSLQFQPLVEHPRNEKTEKDKGLGRLSLIMETMTPRSSNFFYSPQRWHVPFAILYSCPPVMALSTHFQINRHEKVTVEDVMGNRCCPHSPGLEEPSLILIGLAKLTRIVRPKSSDSF